MTDPAPPKSPYMALRSYADQLEKDIAIMWKSNHVITIAALSFVAGVVVKWVL